MPERSFYSDRVADAAPRIREEVTPSAWRGLVALIRRRVADGSLAHEFPKQGCEDGSWITETDEAAFYDMLDALVPNLGQQAEPWLDTALTYLNPDEPPPDADGP
jgi:hypothetical protein